MNSWHEQKEYQPFLSLSLSYVFNLSHLHLSIWIPSSYQHFSIPSITLDTFKVIYHGLPFDVPPTLHDIILIKSYQFILLTFSHYGSPLFTFFCFILSLRKWIKKNVSPLKHTIQKRRDSQEIAYVFHRGRRNLILSWLLKIVSLAETRQHYRLQLL